VAAVLAVAAVAGAGCDGSSPTPNDQGEPPSSGAASGLRSPVPSPSSGGLQLQHGTPDPDRVARASEIKDRHDERLFAVPGVVGTGVGVASDTGEVVIEIYVVRLSDRLRRALPPQLDGVRVLIVETGGFRAR